MKINARFTVKAVGLDDCNAIDFRKYSYIMKLCTSFGSQDVLHTEPETVFSENGESLLHSIEYDGLQSEIPLVYCDVLCAGICTDKNVFINSSLDINVNNNWTVFNKKFSGGETTRNSRFDKICTISNKRIFIDSQFPVGHPNDPFEKSKIERQLASRLKYAPSSIDYMSFSYPDQKDASLCGPAAFFHTLLKDQPSLYSQFIKDLWNSGEARLGKLSIIPSQGCCHPINYTHNDGSTRVPAIDWISMASLRDDENIYLEYSSPDDELSGVTMPEGMVKWINAINTEVLYRHMTLFSWPIYMVVQLNRYVDSTSHVAVLIHHNLLLGGDSLGPTHWIVWEGTLTVVSTQQPVDENTPSDALVDIKLFSWGEVKNMIQFPVGRTLTLKKFASYIYGCVVFKKVT